MVHPPPYRATSFPSNNIHERNLAFNISISFILFQRNYPSKWTFYVVFNDEQVVPNWIETEHTMFLQGWRQLGGWNWYCIIAVSHFHITSIWSEDYRTVHACEYYKPRFENVVALHERHFLFFFLLSYPPPSPTHPILPHATLSGTS